MNESVWSNLCPGQQGVMQYIHHVRVCLSFLWLNFHDNVASIWCYSTKICTKQHSYVNQKTTNYCVAKHAQLSPGCFSVCLSMPGEISMKVVGKFSQLLLGTKAIFLYVSSPDLKPSGPCKKLGQRFIHLCKGRKGEAVITQISVDRELKHAPQKVTLWKLILMFFGETEGELSIEEEFCTELRKKKKSFHLSSPNFSLVWFNFWFSCSILLFRWEASSETKLAWLWSVSSVRAKPLADLKHDTRFTYPDS